MEEKKKEIDNFVVVAILSFCLFIPEPFIFSHVRLETSQRQASTSVSPVVHSTALNVEGLCLIHD